MSEPARKMSLIGTGLFPPTVVHAMVALLISAPLYLFFIRSMEAARKRKQVLAEAER